MMRRRLLLLSATLAAATALLVVRALVLRPGEIVCHGHREGTDQHYFVGAGGAAVRATSETVTDAALHPIGTFTDLTAAVQALPSGGWMDVHYMVSPGTYRIEAEPAGGLPAHRDVGSVDVHPGAISTVTLNDCT